MDPSFNVTAQPDFLKIAMQVIGSDDEELQDQTAAIEETSKQTKTITDIAVNLLASQEKSKVDDSDDEKVELSEADKNLKQGWDKDVVLDLPKETDYSIHFQDNACAIELHDGTKRKVSIYHEDEFTQVSHLSERYKERIEVILSSTLQHPNALKQLNSNKELDIRVTLHPDNADAIKIIEKHNQSAKNSHT